MPREEVKPWLRTRFFPHIWCPGCGHGIILHAILRSLIDLGKTREETVIASGIGCSSRMPGYINANTVHTTHGRSLGFATGIKLANPELTVVDVMGDGDCTAIGGNHFIHACRRNIDLTTIIFNNSIYGMTGGQASPLTPAGAFATTAPFGQLDRSFDIAALAIAAGSTYVARGTAYHAVQLTDLVAKGIQNKGFSVIDAITQCPTSFGRKNKMGAPATMMQWQKDHAVMIQAASKMQPADLADKFVIGELHKSEAPEYTAEYDKLIARLRAQGGAQA